MTALRFLLADATDERFRAAVLIGLASIPFLVVETWLFASDLGSGGFVSGTSLFVACVVSGYLYGPRPEGAAYAGVLTGFVGGLPVVLWASVTILIRLWGYTPVTDVVANSVGVVALSVLMVPLTAVIWGALLVLIGALGGAIGGWTSGRITPPRRLRSGG